jgi:hypothetical protein
MDDSPVFILDSSDNERMRPGIHAMSTFYKTIKLILWVTAVVFIIVSPIFKHMFPILLGTGCAIFCFGVVFFMLEFKERFYQDGIRVAKSTLDAQKAIENSVQCGKMDGTIILNNMSSIPELKARSNHPLKFVLSNQYTWKIDIPE